MLKSNNRLLDSLPVAIRQKILRLSERFVFSASDVLSETNAPLSHVYFPVKGFILLIATDEQHADLSVGLVDREGLVGLPGMLGRCSSSLRAVVLGSGWGWRLSFKTFRQLLIDDDLLAQAMNAYLAAVRDDLVMNVLCQRFHGVCPHLAFWLSLHQSQKNSHDLRLTHKLFEQLLDVRSSSITTCASSLQQTGFISYGRRDYHLHGRFGFERAACDCYRHHRHIFNKLFQQIEALEHDLNQKP